YQPLSLSTSAFCVRNQLEDVRSHPRISAEDRALCGIFHFEPAAFSRLARNIAERATLERAMGSDCLSDVRIRGQHGRMAPDVFGHAHGEHSRCAAGQFRGVDGAVGYCAVPVGAHPSRAGLDCKGFIPDNINNTAAASASAVERKKGTRAPKYFQSSPVRMLARSMALLVTKA